MMQDSNHETKIFIFLLQQNAVPLPHLYGSRGSSRATSVEFSSKSNTRYQRIQGIKEHCSSNAKRMKVSQLKEETQEENRVVSLLYREATSLWNFVGQSTMRSARVRGEEPQGRGRYRRTARKQSNSGRRNRQ